MSWGERSCKHCGNCPIPSECSYETCRVDCRKYEWDGKTEPDSVSKKDLTDHLIDESKKRGIE